MDLLLMNLTGYYLNINIIREAFYKLQKVLNTFLMPRKLINYITCSIDVCKSAHLWLEDSQERYKIMNLSKKKRYSTLNKNENYLNILMQEKLT